MNRLLYLAFWGAALAAQAQNWSAPVAVTMGAGDDHSLAFGYNYGSYWAAWDRTEAGNTDIYAARLDLVNGTLSEVARLTYNESADEKPVFSFMLDPHNGLFYQSNQNGPWAIYYIEQTETGFSEPWLTLYSNTNLYEPRFWPMNTCLGNVPTLFLRSDSAALEFEYGWQEYFEIPPDTAFYIGVGNSGAPVLSHTGFWNSDNWIITVQLVRWAWETEIGGSSVIEYVYSHLRDSTISPITYSGTISDPAYSFHHPEIGEGAINFEREIDGQSDLVHSFLDEETGIWSEPTLLVPDLASEKNWAGGVYETDLYGNWDIAYWHPLFQTPEIIDDDPAEDRNPVIIGSEGYRHALWESNRDGSWKIYHSQRENVGVEPNPSSSLPQYIEVSVHPNPGNAEFRIDLELPKAGNVEAAIYDFSGRRVAMILNGVFPAGSKTLSWDASEITSGIYLLRVESADKIQTRKMAVLK